MIMTTIKYILAFFLLLSAEQQPLFAQSQNAAQTWIILSDIKESAKADYEKWMTDIFFAPMQSSTNPVLKQQFSTARWQKPVRQNADKTWTYCILLDPAIPNADYGIESFLVKSYGETQGKTYLKQYESFMATAGQIHFFETSKGLMTPSVSSEEEAIKKVIEDENAAFNAGDIEKTRSFFNFQPYNIGMLTTENGVTVYMAGKEVSNFYNTIKNNNITATHNNFNIKINGNTAWETNDQTQMKEGKVLLTSHQMRSLEKVNGSWKIITFSGHHSKP